MTGFGDKRHKGLSEHIVESVYLWVWFRVVHRQILADFEKHFRRSLFLSLQNKLFCCQARCTAMPPL